MGRSLYTRNKNLNEIQLNELMSQSHRTKSLSKGIKMVSNTKDPQICCIPHGRRGLAHGLFPNGKVSNLNAPLYSSTMQRYVPFFHRIQKHCA